MPRQLENSFWHMCFERPRKVRGYVLSKRLNAVADVEAVLWLHYAVEVGLFPTADAELILQSNRNRLRSSLKLAERISGMFSPQLRTFFAQALNDFQSILEIRYSARLERGLLNPIIMEMLFNEVARANSNPLPLLFSDLLTFGTDSSWRSLMKKTPNPAKVLAGTGSKIDLICAGYFSVLDHMSAMSELLQYCSDESRGEQSAVRDAQADQTFLWLGERTRLIHLWRVKLDNPAII